MEISCWIGDWGNGQIGHGKSVEISNSVILYAHISTGSAGGLTSSESGKSLLAASLERRDAWLRVSQT